MVDVDFIEIPILQRDYAQGSQAAAEIRDAFLDNLRSALTGTAAPLDLDFIYGSIQGRTLSLLDGQQRLTTLFLLHWYLAHRDGEAEDFRRRWVSASEGRSRFSYATRPSATEFFDAIATRSFSLPTAGRLSETLQDEKWFFDTWLRDPTVRSACVMLDAIDHYFGEHTGLYGKLVDERLITFHFLELRNFGLSDDLYIKMNARGKPLTPFENLKAWLVERVAGKPWANDFDTKLDQSWTDFFWTLARRGGAQHRATFDELFLRFFYVAAFLQACEMVPGSFYALPADGRNWITTLRDVPAQIPLRELESHGALSADALGDLMCSLDHFASKEGAHHVPLLRSVLVQRPEYDDLLKLHALIVFRRKVANSQPDLSLAPAQLDAWLRVTTNLIRNSRIEEPGAAVQAVRGLTTLSGHALSLYEHLSQGVPAGLGFSREQVEEEVRKAALIVADPSWEPLLLRAESHWYLQGRIGFLLELASVSASAPPDPSSFEKYASALADVLTRENLTSRDFILQRALLSLYDFMPAASGGNHTFCIANATSYRDRLENWLPVVQDKRFRQLLDVVVRRGADALPHLVENSGASDWRAYLISNPALMSYCGARMVRHSGAGDILLLTKTRLTGFHAELRSLALNEELRRRLKQGELDGVQDVRYRDVHGDDRPELILRAGADYRISWSGGIWKCSRETGEAAPLPEAVVAIAAGYAA